MFLQRDALQKELEEMQKLLEDSDEDQTKETKTSILAPQGWGLDGSQPPTTNPGDTGVRKDIAHLKALITFLEEEFMPMKKKLDTLLEGNTVTYDILWLLYHEGCEVIYSDVHAGVKSAGKVFLQSLALSDVRLHTLLIFVVPEQCNHTLRLWFSTLIITARRSTISKYFCMTNVHDVKR